MYSDDDVEARMDIYDETEEEAREALDELYFGSDDDDEDDEE